MTRIELGTGVGVTGFTPVEVSYSRNSKDGSIGIIAYLVGSHFNERIDGIVTASSSGSIENDSLATTGGKLVITGDAEAAEATATKSATHSTFMYMWPKTQIHGNSEIPVAQVEEITSGVKHTLKMRTKFEDLSNGDKLIIDLDAGNSVTGTLPVLSIKEERSGTETTLESFTLPSGETSIDWQIKFLDEGVTKFSYKTNSGLPTLLWRGDLTADIAECKVMHELLTNEATPTRSVSIDFLWIFYKTIFAGFDVPMIKKELGCVCIFDTNGTETETNWIPVFSKDHQFIGDRVIQNGLFRMRFKSTPAIQCFGWNSGTSAWVSVGSLLPQNKSGSLATSLVDVIIEKFNDSFIAINAKFGIVDYRITFRKGMPYARIRLNSTKVTWSTTKQRFALSADTVATNLTNYNQKFSDDTNKGNPLNLSTPVTTTTFTDDTDVDTGLQHIDDNWFATYDVSSTDVVGWIGSIFIPNALEVEATSSTVLKEIRFGWRQDCIISIGMLESLPTQTFSGVPRMFHPGDDDDYVKWRANASIFDFDQSPFVKKRR